MATISPRAMALIAKAPSPVRSDAIAGAQTLDNTVAIRPAQREAQPPAAAAMVNAESDPPGDTAATPERADAEALVREFAAAYAAGDLARFDRLFVGVGNAANAAVAGQAGGAERVGHRGRCVLHRLARRQLERLGIEVGVRRGDEAFAAAVAAEIVGLTSVHELMLAILIDRHSADRIFCSR